jgi:hypothetical protein
MKKLIVAVALVAQTSTMCFAETFFWEDKKGIHTTDDVLKLPPKFRDKYEKYIKQNPKQGSKEIQTTKVEKIVEKIIPESAKSAVRALKKLEARCQAGISYRDYPIAIGDAKFEVNLYLESSDAQKNRELAESIQAAMNHYDNASTFWALKFEYIPISGNVLEFYPTSSPEGKVISAIYPELNKLSKDGGAITVFNDSDGKHEKYYLDKVVNHAMSAAAKDLKTATQLLSKQ